MIPLRRLRTEDAIPPKYRTPRKDPYEADLMRRRLAGDKPSSSHWKNAKEQLERETHGKCAYCEAPTNVVAHGDVEHFRPKDTYWWLAYCWDNWLFSCQICNQSHKGARFPVSGSPMAEWQFDDDEIDALGGSLAPDPLDGEPRYSLAAFWQEVDLERADLLDPYREDPTTVIAWEADEIDEEVRLIAANGSTRIKRRADACVEVLGLNREELKRERWATFRTLRVLVNIWSSLEDDDPRVPAIEDELRDMMSPKAPYAGMCRYFVRTHWGIEL